LKPGESPGRPTAAQDSGADPDTGGQRWLQRCAEGDPVACRELVDRHARVAGTIILRTIGRQAPVEDLLQETFLRVFRALPEFEGRARLSTWICTIAQRVAYDELRRQRRSPQTVSDEQAPEAGDDTDLEGELAGEESDALVRRELAALPDRYRLPLVYATIDGLDYDTIGRMLGMPVGTIKTNVFRGKKLLRDRLAPRLRPDAGTA
jgi:RNA polymerase sigma-70 factor, ECF subfamily